MNTEKAIAVLWSATAQKLHIEPLSQTLEMGQKSYLEDKSSDYILVAITESHAEASELLLHLIDKKDCLSCKSVS
jgi:hypothetical protein